MSNIQITFTLKAPKTTIDPTPEEIEKWIRFSLGETAELELNNPLVDYHLEALRNSIEIDYF